MQAMLQVYRQHNVPTDVRLLIEEHVDKLLASQRRAKQQEINKKYGDILSFPITLRRTEWSWWISSETYPYDEDCDPDTYIHPEYPKWRLDDMIVNEYPWLEDDEGIAARTRIIRADAYYRQKFVPDYSIDHIRRKRLRIEAEYGDVLNPVINAMWMRGCAYAMFGTGDEEMDKELNTSIIPWKGDRGTS